MRIDLYSTATLNRCLPFLACLYMAVMTCSTVLGNKLILTGLGVLSAASLISPIWYVLGDIITEVYGYRAARKLFWSVIICQFLFAMACYYIIRIDSPSYWIGEDGYKLVLGDLLKFSLVNFISITLAWHLNAKLLVKWKLLLRGKYFWLRSIGSSGIALIIYTVISVTINVYGIADHKDILSIVFGSCLLKLGYMVVLAYPANMVVVLLNRLETSNEKVLLENY